jgi:hypothetical protein
MVSVTGAARANFEIKIVDNVVDPSDVSVLKSSVVSSS